jgi:hypothetical protein
MYVSVIYPAVKEADYYIPILINEVFSHRRAGTLTNSTCWTPAPIQARTS